MLGNIRFMALLLSGCLGASEMYMWGCDLICYEFDGEFWKGTTGFDGLSYHCSTTVGKTTVKIFCPCRSGMDKRICCES